MKTIWDVQLQERLLAAVRQEAAYLRGEGMTPTDMKMLKRLSWALVYLPHGVELMDEVGHLHAKEADDPSRLSDLEAVSLAVDYYDL